MATTRFCLKKQRKASVVVKVFVAYKMYFVSAITCTYRRLLFLHKPIVEMLFFDNIVYTFD